MGKSRARDARREDDVPTLSGGDPAKTWDQAARAHWWEAFEQLNRIFRDALLQLVKQGDTLWLHDYHLMLLPSMLAESEDFAPGLSHHSQSDTAPRKRLFHE